MVTMATRKQLSSVTQRLFTNHLECDICHCPYQDPKTLCCLHSFCMDCLMRYRDARKTRKLHCPVCQQLTQLPSVGVRGLPDSITLMHLAEDMEWIGEQNKDSMNKPTCPKHKAKVMRFYCDTCRMLICRDCIVLDHPRENHQILDTKADRTGYKQALVHHFPDYEKTLASITNDHDRIVEAKRELRDRVDAAIKDVTTRTAEVMCTPEVRAEEEKIIGEICTLEECQKSKLSRLARVGERRKLSRQVLETGRDDATAYDYDFLALYDVIIMGMEMLSGCSPPRAEGVRSYPAFAHSWKVEAPLGKVVMEDTWELCCAFGKRGSGPGEFESVRGIAAAEPNEIAVADWRNAQVLIFNNKGHIKDSILILANDIVSTKDQWVILSTSFVKVYNRGNKQLADEFQTRQQGDEVGKVYEAPLSLAIRTDGNIIVGYRGRGTLTEHSPTSGDLVRTIPVQISPSFLAVMSNNWLVISDHVKGLVEVVEVADDKAVTLFTIRPTISGERVKSCRGVCSNDSGIYLGVSTGFHNGGHVHHYDNEGDFISCIAQGLYGPYGITFTADGQELAVADHHSVKIYHKV
ncbi:uncharacterized protein LOC110982994 isoform X1 [Acanthaster planci]|uniref:Uncharacterized protein LOC110982994 isoform X1 n=1 Tax=Acanthaster planci TaxID=133434 RepID=A0A8B7YYF5_ACAPL|nr:uncharacterized protein LOC110982994 isoform X1 [Acanthaster planci]